MNKNFFKKKINLKITSERIENYEYETIYNYKTYNFIKNKDNKKYISKPKISIIYFVQNINF